MKREYAEACLRDYIKARPNIVLTAPMFCEALEGNTSAPQYVTRLMKERRVTRRPVKYNGTRGFVYEWHELPIPVPQHKIQSENGEVVTVSREYATNLQLKRLDEWFMDFCNEKQIIEGANQFRKFVHEKAENSK